MFWQQDEDKQAVYKVPDDISDLSFAIKCKSLPLDHAHAFTRAVREQLPWIEDEPQAGIHLIHGAESGNGWFRPDDPENQLLHLSRRARMSIRLPKERIDDACALTGAALDIDGYSLEVGESKIKQFSSISTLHARYVVCSELDEEESFLETVAVQMSDMGVPVRKMLCGKITRFVFPDETVFTRSIMVADLDPEHSVTLQQNGIGPGRLSGFGLFIPHKGISAVNEAQESS